MINIVFVILNYNIVEETMNCVKSIETRIDTENYKIVVVDNCSKELIFDQLKITFKDDSKIDLIRTDENIGFARGNNFGIVFAKKYNPKYICCINNDTLLVSKDFYSVLERKYQKYGAAIVGPRILLKNGNEQHRNGRLLTIDEYKSLCKELSQPISDSQLSFSKEFVKKLKTNRFIRKVYDRFIANRRKQRSKYFEETTDVILHGCWLIFTPAFFEKLDGFNPNTFLYLEEELLYASVVANNLHTLYAPDLIIRHLEDVSTDTLALNNKEKREFSQHHTMNSLKVLITYLEEHKNDIYRL